LAMAPALIILAYSLEYIGGKPTPLLPMVGATVSMMVLGAHNSQEKLWLKDGIGFSQLIQKNTTWAALLLSAGFVFVASITPSISVKQIIDYVSEKTQDVNDREIGQSLGLDSAPENRRFSATGGGNGLSVKQEGGMPVNYLVGTGPELSNRVMLNVKVDDPNLSQSEIDLNGIPTYYFKSITYDHYNAQGWSTEETFDEIFEAGDTLPEIFSTNQRLLHQEFEMKEDTSGLAYSTGTIISSDVEYRIAWRNDPEIAPRTDMFGAIVGIQSYQVDSLLPVFGEEDLRGAGENYPQWITDTYLNLPNSVTERVLLLAQELTATSPTPYDRAIAIEQYLRQFPYTLDLPPRPLGRDIADYFLFSLKKGYCDYYATTMAVLARAAGLPARMAVGYIGSSYDTETGTYKVTADQAHSWVEIYFPNYGWVQFEPTAGRNEITRPMDSLEIQVNLDFGNSAVPIDTNPGVKTIEMSKILMPLISLLFGSLVVWNTWDTFKLQRMPAKPMFEALYSRVQRFSGQIGVPMADTDTPLEFSALMVRQVEQLAKSDRFGKYILSAPDQLKALIAQFVQVFYSPSTTTIQDKKEGIKSWRKLRKQLTIATLINRFPRLRGRGKRFYK
ncbi:MAG: transglutaminase-like domain-containing protein, partial [Chloroflexota bacterium]